jgi:protoporphyrinogen/coproporphyrinogen III oxidase
VSGGYSPSYCIVGGGISGLVAAYRLRVAVGQAATITVFEPADRLGGVLRTIQLGGQPMDVGAEAFITRRPEVPALLAELGLADAQVDTTGARPLIYAAGQLRPLPEQTVNGIPTSAAALAGLVDDATVAKVAAEPDRALSWQRGADPAVADLVADRFGEQVVARSVDPLLSGVYAGSAATIGLRSAAPGVAAALDRGAASLTDAARAALPRPTGDSVFGAVRGGYAVLVDELVRRSGIRWVRQPVVSLHRHHNRWRLHGADDATWEADAAVLAVPAARLAGLLDGVAPRTAAAAARIPVASAAVVALAVPPDTPLPDRSGVLVASGEPLHAKAITLSSRKWGQAGDAALLRLSFGRYGDDVARTAGDDELLAWALDDLVGVFGIRVTPIEVHVQRWLEAMPQYGPGHAALVAELRDGLAPSLALAGNYLNGVGVPACVASGAAAASLLTSAVAR